MKPDKPRKRAPGAGRKPQGARPKVKTSVALDHLLLTALRIEALKRGETVNALIEAGAATIPGPNSWDEARAMTNSDARQDDAPAGA